MSLIIYIKKIRIEVTWLTEEAMIKCDENSPKAS